MKLPMPNRADRSSAVTALLVLGCVLVLAGCANELTVDDSIQSYADSAQQLEEPLRAEYRIQSGDQIDIKFYHAPELNEQLTVRTDGRISLQLIGDLHAAGATPEELAASVSRSYADTLKVPEATVIVRESAARVYVGGEIARPAFVKLDSRLTVLQAIFSAGGFTTFAQPASVLLLRKVNPAERIAVRIDLRDGLSSGTDEILLAADDVVFVPKSAIAKWDKIVEQYIQLAIPFQVSYVKAPFFTTAGSLR